MRQRRHLTRFLVVMVVLAFAIAAAKTTEAQAGSIAIVGGMLVDGNGGSPLHDAVVLIEGEKIVAVGPRGVIQVPPDAKVIPAGGMTVMPGLFDAHVHLLIMGHGKYDEYFPKYRERMRRDIMPVSARELLMHGVTSARDLGANLEDILEVRDRINRGEIPGPRLFVSGPFLQKSLPEKSAYHYDMKAQAAFRWAVNGPDDARQKVRKLVSSGVDCIKVIQASELTSEELGAIIDEAHKAGKTVSTHGMSDAEISLVVKAGADTIEHTGLGPGGLLYSQETVNLLIERGTYVVPTAVVIWVRKLAEDFPEGRFNQEVQKDYPSDLVEDMEASISNFAALRYFDDAPGWIQAGPARWRQLIASGVRVVVGTDSGTPMNFHTDSTWREMQLLVDNGMPPLQAITAATKLPARMMRQDNLGTVEPGKLADVIVVKGNVIEHISNLQNVVHVIKGGKVYK